MNPWVMFALSFAAGAVGGLTYVTKGDGEITRRKLLHTLLRQGCGGLVLALVTLHWTRDSDVAQCIVLGFGMMIGMLGELGIHHLGRMMLLYARKVHGLEASDDLMSDIDAEHRGEPRNRRRSGGSYWSGSSYSRGSSRSSRSRTRDRRPTPADEYDVDDDEEGGVSEDDVTWP